MMTERKLAVVTGASFGLGVEFARQLAAQGMDLIITARRKDRLDAVAAELNQRYGVTVKVVPADLSNEEDVCLLEEELQSDQPVNLLINNAGFSLSGNFWELDRAAQVQMAQVNMLASVRLTHAVLPEMIACRQGGVVQVASMAAFMTGRKMVMYSATKSFLVAFSQALRSELRGTGVHVQALCPGFIQAEIRDPGDPSSYDISRIPGWLALKPRDVVAKSLHEIQSGSGVVIPNFIYRTAGFFLRTDLIGGLIRKLSGG
jgi:uncharacterized protein